MYPELTWFLFPQQPGNELTPGLYRVIRGTENNDHSGSVKTDPDYLFRFNKDHTIIGRYLVSAL